MSALITNDLALPAGYPLPAPPTTSLPDAPNPPPSRAGLDPSVVALTTPSTNEGLSSEPKARSGKSAGTRPEEEQGQEALKKLADDLGKALASSAKELKISIDPALRSAVFRIVDSKSGDVVLQVPSEVALRIRQTLAEAQDDGTSPAGALLQGRA